jgi:hypothetical protein
MMSARDAFAEAVAKKQVRRYRKKGNLRIRAAAAGEVVPTTIDGEKETVNTAGPGDYVVHGTRGEQYVITPQILAARYGEPIGPVDAQGYREYPARGSCYAFRYQGAPDTFKAPWGEEMIINPGDYLATPAIGSDHIYRIEKNAFADTYVEASVDMGAVG